MTSLYVFLFLFTLTNHSTFSMKRFICATCVLLFSAVLSINAQRNAHIIAISANAQNGLVYLAEDAGAQPQYKSTVTIKNYELEEYGKSLYYYGWARPNRGYTFSGWTTTMTNVTKEDAGTATANTNTGTADELFIRPSRMSLERSNPSIITFTANWQKAQAYNVTYAQPQFGSYSVSYNYETISNGAFATKNESYSMQETTANKVVESYPTDRVTLSTTLSTFLGWYEVDATGTETRISTASSITYTISKTAKIVAKFEAPKEQKVAVISGGSTTEYKTFAEAINAANKLNTNPTIKLLDNNLDIAQAFTVSKSMSIDLNGQTLSSTVSNFLNVSGSGVVLTINDSKSASAKPAMAKVVAAKGSGVISVTKSASDNLYAITVTQGSLVLNAGTISVANTNASSSATTTAVYVKAGQRFTNTAGTVSATATANVNALQAESNAVVAINGGLLSAKTTVGSNAYALSTKGSATIVNASFSATSASSNAVAVYSEGTTTITSSDLNATASSSSEAYAVLAANGTTTINSGKFVANASGAKADVKKTNGTLVVKGGDFAHTFDLYRYVSGDVTIYEIPTSDPRYAEGIRYAVVSFSSIKNVAKIGSQYYNTLEEALTAAKSGDFVFLTQNYKLTKSVTVKKGVTLYIPFSAECISQYDSDGIKYVAEPKATNEYSDINPYRTLTMTGSANIEVLGSLVVGGVSYLTNQQMNKTIGCPGSVTGTYGRIDMSKGGHINVAGDAGLYVWGYISGKTKAEGNNLSGAGTIEINNNGVVYESFMIGDWRGGGNTACLGNDPTYKVFPFTQYYVSNVEVPMTIKYGAEEVAMMSLFGDGAKMMQNTNFIGMSDCLFNLVSENSKITKYYDPQTDRLHFDVTGEAEFSEIKIIASSDMTVRSSAFVFPLSSSITIACKNAKLIIPYDIELIPGSEITVDATSSVEIEGKLYVYDVDNWDKYIGSSDKYFTSFVVRPTDHFLNDAWGSKSSLNDAHILVDGKIEVLGSLCTTNAGAAITSNGSGSIMFNNAPVGGTTFQVLETGTKKTDYKVANYKRNETTTYTGPYCTAIPVVPAMLRNANGTYFKTEGAAAATTFGYDKGTWKNAADISTVIDIDMPAGDANRSIYTIQGVKVNGIKTPGLYIINGKKVLVK